MSSPLKQNTTTIQELLNTINALPEKENLDAELNAQTTLLSEQDAKIAELAQVLAGKAGGSSGENVETCTVTFDNESLSNDAPPLFIVATVLEDGVRKNYIYCYNDWDELGRAPCSVSITNVVCSTEICVIVDIPFIETAGEYVEIDGSASYDSISFIDRTHNRTLLRFTAPSVAGENCTIHYAYNA